MYVDALHFRKEEMIRVVERVNGQRIYRDYKPDWHFYVDDPSGEYKTIYGNKVRKITPNTFAERNTLIKQYGGRKWESDVNAVFRCLEQEYSSEELPKLHVAFFDIETDFDKERGYSHPDEAFNPITSIAVYLQWLEQMVCFAVPPKTLTWEEARAVAKEVGSEVILFRSEKEMLKAFLDIIEDADVLSGWNSGGYDIPYTINRVIRELGKVETRKLCLWGEAPKPKVFIEGGRETKTYDLIGRVHLDYMELYKKYSYEERHSYSLDNISEQELGEKKVPYEGTLDQLYNNDFKKFLEYNIQDTRLLDKLDKKLQYIDLCSAIAHQNSVLILTALGTVATVDQAALIEAHRRGMVVPNKSDSSVDTRAAGGWVATPKKGLHKWIGSADLNSLYPSVIRALNMSPETIVGQVDLSGTTRAIADYENEKPSNTFSNWWNDKFYPLEMAGYFDDDNAEKIRLKMEGGESYTLTGAELRKVIFESGEPWCISANGTIFRHDMEGVVPSLLTRWYKERKSMQKVLWGYNQVDAENEKAEGFHIPEELFTEDDVDEHVNHASPYDQQQAFKPEKLNKLIEEGSKKRLVDYMNQHKLTVKNGKAVYRDQAEIRDIKSFWDKRQLVKKINLNSAYGALLNAGSRFYDQRIGQSTTLTGRNITRHMAAKTNESLCGVYDHYGECMIYGDTDSTYFSAYPAIKDDVESGKLEWTKEQAIAIYDKISDDVSDTFPQFLLENFNVPNTMSEGVIKSSREIVAESGLFIKKKRYAALVIDSEGTRLDVGGKPGKVKAMGLDLRRSDTPKFVQEFLSSILLSTLTGHCEEEIIELVKQFKTEFESMKSWKKGTPKAVNNLTKYKQREQNAMEQRMRGRKVQLSIPGHVRASLNWNLMLDIHNDMQTTKIVDGQKIIVCKLKENSTNMTSIAYPTDEDHLPDWFMELPFDDDLMLETIVDKKVDNLLGVLGWDFSKTGSKDSHFDSLFG